MHGVGFAALVASGAPAMADVPDRAAWDIRAAMPGGGLVSDGGAGGRDKADAPFTNLLSLADRGNLASLAHRDSTLSAGPIDVILTADRARHRPSRDDQALGLDRWSLRSIGLGARIGLWRDLTLVAEGDYARMKRRLESVEVTPFRLSTTMAKVGVALLLGDGPRLSFDYLSVKRPSRQGGLIRLAETLGGAPLTGQGPQLSLQSRQAREPGGISWRVSLGSMLRPGADLGLDSDAMQRDRRATAGFSLRL
ncbi:MAG: hypothetical protein PSY12_04680 [bacterium]|nr:hypothetical protein [bacterium]